MGVENIRKAPPRDKIEDAAVVTTQPAMFLV
jgi:hypothetical protein